jgi:hypothetical protein
VRGVCRVPSDGGAAGGCCMTISTVAEARDLLIKLDQGLYQVGNRYVLDGQELTGKQLLALARQLEGGERESKYGNERVEVDGVMFASKAEARRYEDLRRVEQAGEIRDLEPQPRYELQPGFVDGDGVRHRPVFYVGDFSYVEQGRIICEDTKGMATDVYKLKIKLARYIYPHVSFREISV